MDMRNDLMSEEKRLKVCGNRNWLKLDPDLLRRILENLSFFDFQRTKTVCSDWYSVWKTCLIRPPYPWRIISRADSSFFFDPGEDKTYTTTKFLVWLASDIVFDESYCMASFGHCLFMLDSCLAFYILNLVTRKGINLPSIRGGLYIRLQPSDHVGFNKSVVVWINERREDYVVAWIYKQHYLFIYKKGDDSWRSFHYKDANLEIFDMAYKNNKLYLYTIDNHIKIVNISGDSLIDEENPYRNHPFEFVPQQWEYIWKRRIAIRKSGEVLIILSLKETIFEKKILFYIFKVNLECNKWERVDSIGDNEMLVFGHGVTLRAPVQDVDDGIKSDSICFVEEDVWPDCDYASNCGVFNLATSSITRPKKLGCNL